MLKITIPELKNLIKINKIKHCKPYSKLNKKQLLKMANDMKLLDNFVPVKKLKNRRKKFKSNLQLSEPKRPEKKEVKQREVKQREVKQREVKPKKKKKKKKSVEQKIKEDFKRRLTDFQIKEDFKRQLANFKK